MFSCNLAAHDRQKWLYGELCREITSGLSGRTVCSHVFTRTIKKNICFALLQYSWSTMTSGYIDFVSGIGTRSTLHNSWCNSCSFFSWGSRLARKKILWKGGPLGVFKLTWNGGHAGRHFVLPCSVLGGRIPALCSIRGSWWKPYLQGSVCVPPPEEQQPAYTGITHWNELSFWQKRNRIPGTQSNSSLFFFFTFDHMPESQEASELFVGLSHICTPTFWCRLTVKIFGCDLSWRKPLPKAGQISENMQISEGRSWWVFV